jgi:hypothetical protein
LKSFFLPAGKSARIFCQCYFLAGATGKKRAKIKDGAGKKRAKIKDGAGKKRAKKRLISTAHY